jgi:hypothetical protein
VIAKSGKPWFAPKDYGYGGVPISWEGWAATAAFITVFTLNVLLVRGWPRWIGGAVLVCLFVCLACAKTSGGCRWRWGK